MTMLPPEQSPIHQLVTLWRGSRLPTRLEIPACRARLYAAATHEITAHFNTGKSYDPAADHRFRWASQWIEVAEGGRKTVDPDVEFTLTVILTPCPSAQKLAAANDH
jgi:hypothetical protein